MEPLTANLRTSLRDSAQRLGLADFWRWWTAQLATFVPLKARNAMQRRRLRPMVVFGADEAVVWELAHDAAELAYTPTIRIALQGDPAQVAQAARAAMDALGKRARRTGAVGPQVVIALTAQQVLKKRLTYPAAVEANLAHVLGYDLDRHTPFKSDDLYYDAAVIGRDPARNEVRVELVATLKSLVDPLRQKVGAWGADVVAIVPDAPRGSAFPAVATRLNLLPESERIVSRFRPWQIAVPVVLAAALAGAAIAIPVLQKRDEAISLLHQTEQARIQAGGADALRQQLEQSVEDYNFVLARKYAYPSAVQLLDDVTRLLPDDTWLTALELKTIPKGKDPARKEIQLRGESANAGRLVTLLEDSHLFEQAAPRSPTTKIQPGPGEIFDVGAQLKPLAAPQSVPIGIASGAPKAGAPNPPGVADAAPRTSTPNPAAAAPSAKSASGPGSTATPPAGTAAAPPAPVAGQPPARAPTRTAAAAAAPLPDYGPAKFGPLAPDGRSPGDGQ
ncbi:MAG TPA: PilN domain-containing protein [Rudaea sp.]|nr:PilN domain-containing protein [Rudaea sp.]